MSGKTSHHIDWTAFLLALRLAPKVEDEDRHWTVPPTSSGGQRPTTLMRAGVRPEENPDRGLLQGNRHGAVIIDTGTGELWRVSDRCSWIAW